MGRNPIRAKLVLDAEARSRLAGIAKSRTEGQARIERAEVLLACHPGERVTALAQTFQTNSRLLTCAELRSHKIESCLERRDPEFDTRMAQILMVNREVQVPQESNVI